MNKHQDLSFFSCPPEAGLHHLFKREADRHANQPALVHKDEVMTFRELDRLSDQVADLLIKAGIQTEDFVALYMERSFELIVGIFGVLKAGGAYVPIDVDYPADRMAFMVKDAQAKVILTQQRLEDQLPTTNARIICLDNRSDWSPVDPVSLPVQAGQLAYMIYTSGSTGQPKGVMISHENVCNQLEGQQAIAPASIGAMLLTCSISFDVSVLTIFWTLLQGAPLVIPEQGEEKDMTQLAETIHRNQVTHTLTLPSLYTLLLEQAPPEKLQSLQLVNVSGEVCPVSLAQKHEQLIPNGQLYNLYGPTEATVNCTYFTFPPGYSEAKAPIGIPIQNYRIFILDKDLKEVASGTVGEIYIGGTKSVVGRGYWNRPTLTAERFIPSPFGQETGDPLLYKTGDLAHWMPDGNIAFLGRSDFQVKYRGFRIELGEVETAISNLSSVKETVVVLKNQHEVHQQKLVAYVTIHPGEACTVSQIRDHLSKTLPEYMLPSHFVFLDKMPLTTNGKFDRKALPDPMGERPLLDQAYEAPVDQLEQEICQEWEQLLEVAPVGRTDKFFELGGTSIQAARFIGSMMKKWQTSIFITTIFDFPTPASYAGFLKETYPQLVEEHKNNAILVSEEGGNRESSPLLLTPEIIQNFSAYIPQHLEAGARSVTAKVSEQAPIFILAPPRSGTTLLRVMLAGHPGLFACNELQLLHFETLADRNAAYTGKFKLWSEGLIRAVMELQQLTADEAVSFIQELEKNGMTTQAMFDQLKDWIGKRELVDKSPSYLMDAAALEKAKRDFPNAKFIHLVRHPYSMVRSFEQYHMDQVLYLKSHPFNARQLGELVWLESHRNALQFLKTVPADQQFRIVYEDLVKYPEQVMQAMCQNIGLAFHENLLKPYQGLEQKMTDGLYATSRSMGDANFDKKRSIDPKKADDWKGVIQDNFLCAETWELIGEFGYETLAASKSKDDSDEPLVKKQTKKTTNKGAIPSRQIAIVGMACRFPGANSIETFWQNLMDAKDVSHAVREEDLKAEGIVPKGTYVRKTFALDHPYSFDAPFFGYLPKEAAMTDPQHRIFLETAYEALESAGYDPYTYEGQIGVYGGVAKNTYYTHNILTNPELLDAAGSYQEMIAAESTFSVSRLAYKLNLKGPAVNVQTACSTGGVAIHLACQSILQGDSDMVLVGGGRIQSPVNGGYEYVEGGPLSPDGTLRAFDAQANGMVQGNGMGMLVLKELTKATADGDHIWAVIKSSAINNDGAEKSGLTAPSSKGQAACISKALKKAGLTGADIDYFETHGTGTFIGDPIEIRGLAQAIGETPKGFKIPIGSVKTNIGHLDAGACIAGVIKTALALKNQLLPPTLHFTKPNPQLNLTETPFYVTQQVEHWQGKKRPLRAGVSSFGLGGTNAHILLEEYKTDQPSTRSAPVTEAQLMVLSAKTPAALDQMTDRLTDFINEPFSADVSSIAQTLALGRPHFPFRKALIWEPKKLQVIKRPEGAASPHGITFLFPGGGSQYSNMSKGLYDANAFFRSVVDQCFTVLKHQFNLDIKPLVFSNDQNALLKPSIALASLFSFEYALARLWEQWGIVPTDMIGHSMGEYTAACIAGVMSLEDALGLVTVRGQLFETLDGDGCMLSIGTTKAGLLPLLDPDHTISVINKNDSLVVSSSMLGIERLKKKLDEANIENRKIHIAVPAHSPLIDPILDAFRLHLGKINFKEPRIPFVSNVTGTWIKASEATDPEYWIRHIRQTVLFDEGLQTILYQNPSPIKKRIFLEVGPGQTLSSFVRAVPTLKGEHRLVVASVRHPKEVVNDLTFIYKSLAKIWMSGLPVSWDRFYEGRFFQRVPLPTYPFEKKKYFIAPQQIDKTVEPATLGSKSIDQALLVDTSPADTLSGNSALKPMKSQLSRIPVLIGEIQQSLHELSGMEASEMDPQATFLELGFDSLFLSQAVIKFNYKFKLKLSFRMLFEEAPSIEALAAYIDQEIPKELFQPAAPVPVQQPAPKGALSKTTISPPIANSNAVESLIQQQLQIMQQQLLVLRGLGQETGEETTAAPSNQLNPPTPFSSPAHTNVNEEGEEINIKRSTKGVTAKMSNYKKIGGGNDLSPKQLEGLAAFIAEYNAKTKNSKAFSQEHRQHYADPRSVTGFSKLWKEICYQIAHEKSKGAKIWDVDGNEYIDYVMSYGVALFGHMPDFVEEAVVQAIRKGNSIDLLPIEATAMAKMIAEMTGYDRVTLANTGTEAVLGAVRAARVATGKDRIAVFDTDYHGNIDQFLVRGINMKGKNKTLPSSPGIPSYVVEQNLTLDYDDPEVLQKLENEIADLAAVVIEPVQAQNPHWQHKNLIQKIRVLTAKHDVALIFDEIINGFRMDQRGAQGWYGIEADISAYGKSISGGFPISAIAGKAKYMDAFDGGIWNYGDDSSPDGVITYFASTFIKNPISVAAGHAAIKEIQRLGPALQETLNEKTIRFAERIKAIFLKTKAPFMIQSASSFFMLKYADGQPLNRLFNYFLRMRGVNVRERPCFISTAHTDADFEQTYKGFEDAIHDMFEMGVIQPYEGEDLNVIVRKEKEPQLESRKKALTVPLTEGQQEIFLSDQLSADASKAYNIATEIKLEGAPLKVERMKLALQALVDRHEALRTVIGENGKTQTILPELKIDIPYIDLSAEADKSTLLESLYQEEAEHHFDLQNGPLVRFKIVRLEADISLVFIHVHHIICDGWSLGILTKELGQMYGSKYQERRMAVMEQLAIPKAISEYAVEQAALQDSDLYQQNETYWLKRFEDRVPVLELPLDNQRPPVKTHPGAVEKIGFDAEMVAAIRKTAAKEGTTFYVFMLAAYQAFLSRITGQEDFVLGIAAAGHNLPGNQHLVAHAIGLLPVRTRVNGQLSFRDYVKTVRGEVLDAFDHQQFTYGSLVKKLRLERSANRNTLVSVAFNLDSPLEDLFFGAHRASTRAIPRHYETFDTFINLKPLGKTVDFEWNYNTDLFRSETIQLRLKEFKQFMQSILVHVEAPITSLQLLPDVEINKLESYRLGEGIDFPHHLCLHELFEQQVEKNPDKLAVAMTDGGELTYQQLNDRANAVATQLIEQGVQAGEYVGLIVERSLDMLAGIYGILKAGAAYVPIDPRNPKQRIDFTLDDAGCKVLLTHSALKDTFKTFDGRLILVDEVSCQSRVHQTERVTVNGLFPAYIIYTSGSTGTPKGVIIRHENAVNTLFAINRKLNLSREDTVYSVSSMSFDMSIPDYFLSLMNGATLLLADESTKKDGFALRASIEHFRPTFMQATPTTWQILRLSGWKGAANLKAVAGGEGFPKELAADMAASCQAVWNGYGPTETTIYATYQEVTPEHLKQCTGEFVAIGSPIANTRVKILDKQGQEVPMGIPGELYIGGKGVSSGYLNRSDYTAEKFIQLSGEEEPYYRTGDLVRLLPNGSIDFLGRLDDQVKIRGYRIELGEIEATLEQSTSVKQAAVQLFKDPSGNPQIAAYVVWNGPADSGALKEYLRQYLPGYMVPAVFMEMETLPMNTSLKVDRKALPKPDFSKLSNAPKEGPTTKGEVLLTNIWKELLGVEDVSVQDDFFELGGHSLAAVQLMSRIKKETGKKLPITSLFQHSTIRKLAGELNGYNLPLSHEAGSNGQEHKEFSSLICIQEGGKKPPLYLVHGGGLHVLFYQNMVKYLDKDQPIYALQARGLNDGEEPLDTLEEMAAHYIKEIKTLNPDGPYCLAGYSLGGLIAWEMAAQLKAENKDVPLLALFDAVAKYEWSGNGSSGNIRKKIKKFGFNMSLLLKEPVKTIGYKSSVLKMQFQHMKGKLTMAYRNNKTNEIEEGYIPFGKDVYEKSLHAYEKYVLRPLQIHVDLFKAKEQMFYLHDPEHYGWDQFALHGLTIHQIEGNHLTLFDDPHGKEVAEALKDRLLEVGKLVSSD